MPTTEKAAPLAAKRFDVEDVLSAMRTVVARFGGDHIYRAPDGETCVYGEEKDGKLVASCLIGHVLVELGVPLTVFAGFAGSVSCIELDLEDAGYPFTHNANQVMQKAQSIQDRAADLTMNYEPSETTWGFALEEAEKFAQRLIEGDN